MDRTYVFNSDGNNGGNFPACMPFMPAGFGGGFGGYGNDGLWGVIYLAIIASIFGWGGNGFGGFGGRGGFGGAIPAELSGNADYNIYALVNTGRTDAPDMEEDLSSLVYRPGSQGSLGENGLPMSAMVRVSPASVVEPVSLNLVRLVSKVKFVMDRGELGGLEVRSVRLMQSPCDVRPFSKESMASEVSDGDYATDEDMTSHYVAVFNTTDTDIPSYTFGLDRIGVLNCSGVKDLWSGEDMKLSDGALSFPINAHGVRLVEIKMTE